MRFVRLAILIATVLAAAARPARADRIAILPGSSVEQTTSVGNDAQSVAALPYRTGSDVTGAAGSSTALYDLSAGQIGVSFQQFAASQGFNASSSGSLAFTPGEDSSYHASLSTQSHGVSAWTMFMDLRDLTTGTTLFSQLLFNGPVPQSEGLPDGAPDGNSGSTAGALQVGHDYELRYVLFSRLPHSGDPLLYRTGAASNTTLIQRDPRIDGPSGTVTGQLGLDIGPEMLTVPNPNALAGGSVLGGCMMVGLWWCRRRARHGLVFG